MLDSSKFRQSPKTLGRGLSTNTQKISFLLILFLLFPSVDSLSLLEASLTIVVSLNSFSGIILNDLNFLSLEQVNVTVTRSIYQEILIS